MQGRQLGHYRILERLGAGGMGEVYRAHDDHLDRDVAIKLLPAESVADPSARARLLREARAAAALNHPGICTIHDVGEAEGHAYIAMELIEGRPLSEWVSARALPIDEVLRCGSEIADALAHAHLRQIVHRDLKSANVILTAGGHVKVLDFGLARRINSQALPEATTEPRATLTEPGALAGTLAYMSPEQLRGEPADARSDVWALGVVLYELAVGNRPFVGQSGFDLSARILNEPPSPFPAKVPIQLRAVIDRCLEKTPVRRYQRASEVGEALEAIRSGTTTPWSALAYRLSRGSWLLPAVAAVVVIAVIAAANLDRIFFPGDVLMILKQPEEWQQTMQRGFELDPLNEFHRTYYGWQLNYQRRYDEAIPIFQQLLTTGPNKAANHLGLWGAYHRKGMYEQALAAARAYSVETREPEFADALGSGADLTAYRAGMARAGEAMAAAAMSRHVPAIRIARMFAHAGNADQAMHWLEKAYENRESPMLRLGVFWDWLDLHGDSRFQDLLRRMKLPL